MKTLETNMKEMESKKRILEEAVDSLNEEIAKLKAKGNGNNLMEVVVVKSGRQPSIFGRIGDQWVAISNPCLLFALNSSFVR